jgi:hypothetical protein
MLSLLDGTASHRSTFVSRAAKIMAKLRVEEITNLWERERTRGLRSGDVRIYSRRGHASWIGEPRTLRADQRRVVATVENFCDAVSCETCFVRPLAHRKNFRARE